MEDFKKNGRRVQENTIEEIQEEYSDLLRRYRNTFTSIIVDIIYEQRRAFPCSIPEHKIEEWVDDYLITELRSRARREFDKILENLRVFFTHITQNIENYPSKNNILGEYETNLEDIKKSSRTDWVEDIIEDFVREFAKRVEFYFDAFMGISNTNFYDNLYELKSSVRHQLLRRSEMLCDDYKDIIKNALKHNTNQMEKQLENVQLPKENEMQLGKYNEIMELNNFELIQENGINYAINKTTGQKYELELDSRKGILILKDSTICFLVDENKSLYFNQEAEKIVCFSGLSMMVTDHWGNNGYGIEEGLAEYTFYQGGRKCTDPGQIAEIINKLQKDVPIYYARISTDQYFQKIVEAINSLGYGQTTEAPTSTPRKR